MRSRPRLILIGAVLLGSATSLTLPPPYSRSKRAITTQPVAHKDFCPIRWGMAGFVAAASLVFSPCLPSHAAEPSVAVRGPNEEVTITLTLPRSVIKSLEGNTGSTPTISIKIAEEELLEKANKQSASAAPTATTTTTTTTTEAPKPVEPKKEELKTDAVATKPTETPPAPMVKAEAPKPLVSDTVSAEKKPEPAVVPPAKTEPPKSEPPKPADVPEQKAEAPPIEKKVEAVEVKKEEPKSEPPKASAVAPEKKPETPSIENKKPEPAVVEPPKASQPKPEEVKKLEAPKVPEVKKEEAPKPAAVPLKPSASSKPPKTVDVSILDKKIQTTIQKKMNGKDDTNLVLSTGEIVGVSAIGVVLLAAVSGALSKDKGANNNRRRPGSNTSRGGSLARRVNGDNVNGSNDYLYGEGSPGYNTKEPPRVEYYGPDIDEFGYPRRDSRNPPRQQQQRRLPDRSNRRNDPYYPNDYRDGGGYNSREPHKYYRPDAKEPKIRPATDPKGGMNERRLRRSKRSYMDDIPEGGYNDKEPW